MREKQEHQNLIDDEHVAANQKDHSYDSNDTQDSEVIFSLMIISLLKYKLINDFNTVSLYFCVLITINDKTLL